MLYLWLYSGIYICQPILHNNIHCDYYKLIRNASRKGFLFIYIIIIILQLNSGVITWFNLFPNLLCAA